MSEIKLIVGLGNPGRQYEATRHNVGFWLIDLLAVKYHARLLNKDKFFGQTASISVNNKIVPLLKPATFMNLSGKSVQAMMNFYQITASQLLVAHDELDISCGELRLKFSGGHGGHNGIRDISRCLRTNAFYRLRIGIGHPGHASAVTSHVLGRPSSVDTILIENALERAIDQLKNVVDGNFDAAIQTLHTKSGK